MIKVPDQPEVTLGDRMNVSKIMNTVKEKERLIFEYMDKLVLTP